MSSTSGDVIRPIRALFEAGSAIGVPDGVLLERFLDGPREAAELAFMAIVERHGPMVLRVCRTVLDSPHDAEDAFQATFLVLARRAGSIRKRGSLASWLHGAASRTAGCARAAEARRRRHERAAAEQAELIMTLESPDDTAGVLHEELERLPERLRAPILLCHLEGLSHEQAAEALAWPVGTVRSRLSRGRDQLRGRLVRRGVAPAVAAAWAADEAAGAAVVPSLVAATARAAAACAVSPWKSAGIVPPSVSVLVEGALNAMFVTRIKLVAIACTGLAAGTFALARPSGRGLERSPRPASVDSTSSPEIEPAVEDKSDANAAAKLGVDEIESDAEVKRRIEVEMLTEEVEALRKHVKDTIRFKLQYRRNPESPEAKEAIEAHAEARRNYEVKSLSLAAARRELAESRRPKIQTSSREDARKAEAPPQPDPRPDSPVPQSPAPRIGSVDVVAVYQGYEKARLENETFRAAKMERDPRYNRIQAELKDEMDLLRKLVPGSEDHRKHKARVDELTASQLTLYDESRRSTDEHDARDGALLRDIEQVVARLAKSRGLSYVVKVSPRAGGAGGPADVREVFTQSILYADPANDLTQEVIRELNRNDKEHSRSPAAW